MGVNIFWAIDAVKVPKQFQKSPGLQLVQINVASLKSMEPDQIIPADDLAPSLRAEGGVGEELKLKFHTRGTHKQLQEIKNVECIYTLTRITKQITCPNSTCHVTIHDCVEILTLRFQKHMNTENQDSRNNVLVMLKISSSGMEALSKMYDSCKANPICIFQILENTGLSRQL